MENLIELKRQIRKNFSLYEMSHETYDLCTEERKFLLKVPVKALYAVVLAAQELKFTGYLYFRDTTGGFEDFHLAIEFIDGQAYYSQYSWGWARRIPARNFASSLKIKKDVKNKIAS